ncbi:MAG: MATE family efflux transporter [Peptococcaceae bacterium]|nr:MATE family efflux transporter [Peptococcaceae bacterium]
MKKEMNTDLFATGSVAKVVLTNVVPSIISMIMVLVYNLADTFFIGRTHNDFMVAAVSVATPVFLIFMALGMLFGIGGTSLISRTLGGNNLAKAKNISSFCFWVSAGVGVFGMFFIWVAMDWLCQVIGASADTIGYVREYLGILAFGIPFLVISNVFSNILRTEGQANRAMIGMILGNMLNVVLDPIMILTLEWNVAGAAIATVIGNVVAAVYYLAYYISGKSMLSIKLKDFSCSNRIPMDVFAIGVPASLNSMLMSVSNIVINKVMFVYGDMAIAALGVAMKVNMIAVMLLIGVGTGIQPVLGYCYGAGNRARFMAVLKFSMVFVIGLSLVMSAICYFGASGLVQAFLEDDAALDLGMKFTRVLIISGPILGILFVLINTIQALGAALPSLVLSVSRQGLIYLPLLFILQAFADSPEMIVAVQPLTDYLATLLAFILFVFAYRSRFPKRQLEPVSSGLLEK